MVILLPVPAYITEYNAVPFETVFIGGFGSNDVFAITVTVLSFGSTTFDAILVVVGAAAATAVDTIEMAVIIGVDDCTADTVGFAFTLAIDTVLVFVRCVDCVVVVKMHGKIENADFGSPELLL